MVVKKSWCGIVPGDGELLAATKVMEPWVARLDLLGLSTGFFPLCPDSLVAWKGSYGSFMWRCVCMPGLQGAPRMDTFFYFKFSGTT